jgi:hypothetical protein
MDWQFYLFGTLIIAALVLLWGWAHGFDSEGDSNSGWSQPSDRYIESWRSGSDDSSAGPSDSVTGGND